MKLESQQMLQRLYTELGQLKHILASTDNAPATEDIGLSYYKQLQIPATQVTKMPDANMRFPHVSPGSVLSNVGTAAGQMNPTWFGNALIFVMRDRLLSIATPNVDLKFGVGGLTKTLSADKPFRLSSYKFICYFMDEHVKLPTDPQINGLNHTYGLVRWESKPYIEKSELQGFFNLIPDPADRGAVWTDLKTNYDMVRVWDMNQPDATQSLFDVDATGNYVPVQEAIAMKTLRPAVNLSKLEPFAKGFLSFNTAGTFRISDLNDKNGMTVPRFGEWQDIIPYGFEVGVCGPNAGRSVLVRVAMAARLSQGNHMYGQAQQTIIQAVDN
jgi:hypothetical protein